MFLSNIGPDGIVWSDYVAGVLPLLTPHRGGDETERRGDQDAGQAGQKGNLACKSESSEATIRIVPSGLRDEDSFAEPCCKEDSAQSPVPR